MCVLVNGEVQKELANGVVKLPFGTEYVLRFKNKNERRAVVKFFIDGENVSGGGYIVEAKSHVDIRRHSDADRAFKFVDLDSPDAVEDGKNGPNPDKVKGTIEARFYMEKERPQPVVIDHHHHYYPRPKPYFPPYQPPYIWCSNEAPPITRTSETLDMNESRSKSRRVGPSGSMCTSKGMASLQGMTLNAAPTEELRDGCTVQGESTGQNFHYVSCNTEDVYTTLNIFLQGHDAPVKAVKPRKTNKIAELETENDELRRKVAELENLRLKEQLAELEKPKKTRKKTEKTVITGEVLEGRPLD